MPVKVAGSRSLLKGTELVAVVGIGCRFPGDVNSPNDFWDLLTSSRNTTGEVPEERWQCYRELGPDFASSVRRAVKFGSFCTGIDHFDAEFFGISPREAELMDPQQRVLLEVSWEALEHAGIPPRDLAGSDTGVFIGVCTGDYGSRILEDLPGIVAWTGIGAATCAVANRISHVLDLRGPSLAVDTACSASLVALHLACQSLRIGESTVAFAGGVNLLVSPGQSLTLGAAGVLAPDGRSKSFDATADGYGRGEGCGVVVLKRLIDATRDGDRVLAVIRGSAVSQDGRTNGIMAPCGAAQEHVMQRACDNAGIERNTVDYIEAHGTGTRIGDPLEAAALSAVYGSGRVPGEPCLIGSVKSNIGHLEGAAGIAGVIKAALALRQAEIPPSLLSTEVSPDIAWDGSGLQLVTERVPWPRRGHPRRAGVSGFGYGGTVAHVVLEQAPVTSTQCDTASAADDEHCLVPLSATSEPALRQYADRLADWVSGRGCAVPLRSIGHTLGLRRSHLAQRAVVLATDASDLAVKLRRFAQGGPQDSPPEGAPDHGVVTGTVVPEAGNGLVWVFSGHGSQWPGMGRELLGVPAFARVIDTLEPIFLEEVGFSPRQALDGRNFEGVDCIQSLIFAMQLGLAELWRCHGVCPAAVIGHSVGEIAAAVVTGELTLHDGARLVCRRSRLLRRVAGRGAMAMVTLPFSEVEDRLCDRDDLVAAICASPATTVIAGDPAAINALVDEWPSGGVAVRRVASDVAFHSPQMDPLLADLSRAASDLSPAAPRIRRYTTALPDSRFVPTANGEYWAANLRNPVQLTAAVAAAVQDGYRAFLEISPHPVVAHSIAESLAEHRVEDAFVGVTLRRNRPAKLALLASVAALHCHGVDVDWARLQPAGDLVTLPTNPWQRRRHCYELSAGARSISRGHDVDSHTLLGSPGTVAGTSLRVWQTVLDDGNRPYPGSHTLSGVEIVPAAVLLATFLRAGVCEGATRALAAVAMRHPLMTADRREVQVVLDGGMVWLASRTPDGSAETEPPWLTHTTAEVVPNGTAGPLPDRLADPNKHRLLPIDPGLVHQRLAEVGVPSTGFDWTIEQLRYGVGMLQARGDICQPACGWPMSWAPVLDAVASIAPTAFPGAPVLRMVVHIDDVVVNGEPPQTVLIDVALDRSHEDTVNVLVADTDGSVVARLTGLRYPVIGEQAGVASRQPVGAVPAAESFSDLAPEQLQERVLAEVGTQIAAEMRLPAGDLNPRRPLLEQGLDSVMTVVIRKRLEKLFGHSLPATVFWQQPTVTAIADHLVGLLSAPYPPSGES